MQSDKLYDAGVTKNNIRTASRNGSSIFERFGKEKITVGIIFGGASVEHDVSLWSAKNIMTACIDAGHDVVLIYVKKDGTWHHSQEYEHIFLSSSSTELTKNILETISSPVSAVPGSGLVSFGRALPIDIIFPIIHGTTGEDGILQGFLETVGILYVGCGVTASAIGMDKAITKVLVEQKGVPVAKYLVAMKKDCPKFSDAEIALGVPLFVKPATLGSSVGVTKVHNEKEYIDAMNVAFSFDRKVLIEEAIVGREVECGILEDDELLASGVGEVATTHEFYSYEAKYLDENGVTITLPADIPTHAKEEIRRYALLAACIIGVRGLARVDFFYSNDGKVIFNEINTLPGFTALSMYPMLWKREEYTSTKLIDTILKSAFKT